MLGLRLRLVGLALGRELQRLFFLQPRDDLLMVAPQLEQLRLQALGRGGRLLGQALLQPLDLEPVRALEAEKVRLVGRLLRRLRRHPVARGLLHGRAMGLLQIDQLGLEIEPHLLGVRPYPLQILRGALARPLDFVLSLAQLLVGVVEPSLQALFPLDRLVLVLRELCHLLIGGHEGLLEAQRALVEIATRPLLLADLVLVVEDQPLLGVEPVPQVEDVLLLAVDDLAQAQKIALLRERPLVRGVGHALALLVHLLAQRLPLPLERRDPRLQLVGARLRDTLLVGDLLDDRP